MYLLGGGGGGHLSVDEAEIENERTTSSIYRNIVLMLKSPPLQELPPHLCSMDRFCKRACVGVRILINMSNRICLVVYLQREREGERERGGRGRGRGEREREGEREGEGEGEGEGEKQTETK